MARQQLGKGVWYDPSVKGYVMLDITAHAPKPEPLVVDGVALFPKSEYHISLANVRAIAGGDMSKESQIVSAMKGCLSDEAVSLTWVGFGGNVYVCKKPNADNETQVTVIADVQLAGIEALQALMCERVGVNISTTLHVTLLKSANSPYGIGVNSAADLAAYCVKRDDVANAMHLNIQTNSL